MRRLSAHSTWFALGILIALGLWLYFDLKRPTREPDQNPKVSEIAGIQADEVTKIEIAHDGSAIIIEKAAGKWSLQSPVKAPADAETVRGALDGLLDQTSDFVMEKPPADLAKYGLASPKRTITLVGSGKRAVLQIGDQDPGKSSVFTRLADGGKVFLAGSSAVDAFTTKTANELRDKTVLTISRDKIEQIRLSRPDGYVTLVKSNKKWSLTEPVTAPADEFAADGIADTLATLKADKFVAAGVTDLARYGLAAPVLTIEVRASGGAQYGVRVGKEAAGGSVYVARTSDADVVEIAKTTFDTLNKSLADLRSKKMVDVQTDEVERVAVTARGVRWEVARTGSDWKFVAPKPGQKADAIDVDNAILDATGSADRWVADNPTEADLARYGLVKPDLTAELTVKGGAVKRLEIGKKDSSGDYFARGADTGSSVFAVGSYVLDRLKTEPKVVK